MAELEAYVRDRDVRKTAKPILLTEGTFDLEVAKGGVVLVDFWAAWCGPCLRMAPTVEQVAVDFAGKVRVGKLNTDENPTIAQRFGITSIPTLIVFRDGKPVDAIVGAVPREELERTL